MADLLFSNGSLYISNLKIKRGKWKVVYDDFKDEMFTHDVNQGKYITFFLVGTRPDGTLVYKEE